MRRVQAYKNKASLPRKDSDVHGRDHTRGSLPPPLDLFAFALRRHASYVWRYGKPSTTNFMFGDLSSLYVW